MKKLILIFITAIMMVGCVTNSRAKMYSKAKEKSILDFQNGSRGKCNRYKH